MPTFLFLRQNSVKASVSGANIAAVEAKINELLNPSDTESSSTSSLVPGMVREQIIYMNSFQCFSYKLAFATCQYQS